MKKNTTSESKVIWTAVILLASTTFVSSQDQDELPNIDDLIGNIIQFERQNFEEPANDFSSTNHFDFIVVGAGVAGCTVASRLSEIGSWKVLLLEAGSEETFAIDIPFYSGSGGNVDDWNYQIFDQVYGGCPSGPNASCPYPRGKVMGGSSSVNLMLFVRGNRRDYDNWARLGNTGWSYEDVLPYFKKMENVQIPSLRNSFYHGTQGNIMNSRPEETIFSNLTLEAAMEMGIPEVDYNGANQTGISHIQSTTYRGIRWSANRGYLFPANRRQNLYVRKRSQVTKIILRNKRAVGVEYIRDGKIQRAYAKKEVILSSGSINTPQILMLSGIGPQDELDRYDIPVAQDLPVGRYMVDHVMFLGLIMVFNQTLYPNRFQDQMNYYNYANYFLNREGAITSTRATEIFRFSEVGEEALNDSWTNMEFFVFRQPDVSRSSILNYGFTQETYETFFRPVQNLSAFHPVVVHLRPRSIGYVNITSNNPLTPPLINPNFFSEESDVQEMVTAIKETIELYTSGPFRNYGTHVYNASLPACVQYEFMSDEYWSCAVRWASATIFHPCCTCKMGPKNDTQSIVTPDLKVRGIKGLRIIDASVMPVIPAAHLQIPTYMVAEKGSDLVKQTYLKYSIPETTV